MSQIAPHRASRSGASNLESQATYFSAQKRNQRIGEREQTQDETEEALRSNMIFTCCYVCRASGAPSPLMPSNAKIDNSITPPYIDISRTYEFASAIGPPM